MKRIQFNSSYRELIEKGIYRVETASGFPVRIICWNAKGLEPIIALITIDSGDELVQSYMTNGRCYDQPHPKDLIINVPSLTTNFQRTLESYLDILQKPFSKEISEILLNIAKVELRDEILNEFLPRWRRELPVGEKYIHHNGYYLTYSDLENLPKEDLDFLNYEVK